MNGLELFAGAGGGILAHRLNDIRTVCAVEIDEYARSILVARQNDGTFEPFPIWDDIRTFDGRRWRGVADVVSGGFPCQPFSTASHGKRLAVDLWPEMLRVVDEVRPKIVFAENVSKKPIERAACDLCELGYDPVTTVLSAADVGGDHIRRRFWLFAYADDEIEFLRSEHAKMAKLPQLQNGVWRDPPDRSGVPDGVAHRTHRIRAAGNGQVPVVAAVAFRELLKIAVEKENLNQNQEVKMR